MKFLLLKNKMELKKYIYKFFIIQIILLMIYLMLNINLISSLTIEQYAAILGLEKVKDSYFLNIMMKLVSYLIVLYINVRLFVDSILGNIQYIMLRITKKKWVLYEIFNYTIYVLIMRLIYNLIILLAILILKANIDYIDVFILIIKDFIFYIMLSLFIVSITILFSFKGRNKLYAIIPVSVLILSLFVNIVSIPIYILILCSIISLIFNIIYFNPINFYNEYCKK